MESAASLARTTAPERERQAGLLARAGLLAAATDPELDRWTAALCRATGAAVAALALLDGDRVLVKSLCTSTGADAEPAELASGEALTDYLAARIAPPTDPAYLEVPIVVEEQLLGLIGIADDVARQWTACDQRMLEDAAAAVGTEMRLRLAKDEAARAHELVLSHGKVHELIAAAAPLEEVLVELAEGIERHDPSVIACVVLLDRESNTLHPGPGPSRPAHYP